MLEVLKTTALLHKVNTLNAMVLLPEDVLWMACRGGATAFGLPQQIGSLEKGKRPGIILVDNIDWKTMKLTEKSKSVRLA